MAQLKIKYAKEDSLLLENATADFFRKVLPIGAEDVLNPENKLVNMLLSYHSDDGGAVIVTRVRVDWVKYEAEKKQEKLGLNTI